MQTTLAVTVTVYSTPVCMQCKMTYLALDKAGIDYTIVDVSQSPEAAKWITEELGYAQAPVVVVDQDPDNHWSGFSPDKINALITN